MSSLLYQPIKVGSIECNNRVAMAPLTRARATEDHIPTERMIEYYNQRASAGLIVSEATNICQEGVGWYRSPGIWNQEQIEAWKPITKGVHDHKGKIVCQLWHTGRRAHSSLSNMEIVSCSPIKLSTHGHGPGGVRLQAEVPRELTIPEIEKAVKAYGLAAKNAMEAGFDGVEIHGANGYLIDQFLQSCSNKRTDKYGGSIENRLRFLTEIIDEILKFVPKECVGVRISPHGDSGDMGSEDNVEQFSAAIKLMTERGLAFIHLMDGVFGVKTDKIEQFTLKQGREVINQVIKSDQKIVLMGNGSYTKESAESRLTEGDEDVMISFGIPYIANPDLYERFKYGLDLTPPVEMKYWFFPTEEEGLEAGYTTFSKAELPKNASRRSSQVDARPPLLESSSSSNFPPEVWMEGKL